MLQLAQNGGNRAFFISFKCSITDEFGDTNPNQEEGDSMYFAPLQ